MGFGYYTRKMDFELLDAFYDLDGNFSLTPPTPTRPGRAGTPEDDIYSGW